MATFKDIIKSDAAVFLNEDEFAEEHEIDGRKIKVLIDNNEHLEREKRYKTIDEGIYHKQILFYVSAVDFGRLPRYGRILMFDDKQYRVVDAIREDGIYSITIEANKS